MRFDQYRCFGRQQRNLLVNRSNSARWRRRISEDLPHSANPRFEVRIMAIWQQVSFEDANDGPAPGRGWHHAESVPPALLARADKVIE